MPKRPSVYILASDIHGTLYIGVTARLEDRIAEHRQDLIDGFSERYGVHRLVYFEFHKTMDEAIKREKQIKKWKRAWKIRLIEQLNPEWRDLMDETGVIQNTGPGGQAESN